MKETAKVIKTIATIFVPFDIVILHATADFCDFRRRKRDKRDCRRDRAGNSAATARFDRSARIQIPNRLVLIFRPLRPDFRTRNKLSFLTQSVFRRDWRKASRRRRDTQSGRSAARNQQSGANRVFDKIRPKRERQSRKRLLGWD